MEENIPFQSSFLQVHVVVQGIGYGNDGGCLCRVGNGGSSKNATVLRDCAWVVQDSNNGYCQ